MNTLLKDFISNDWYFLIFWVVIFAGGIFGILKIKKKSLNFTKIAFFISVTLILLPMIDIIEYQSTISGFHDQNNADTLNIETKKSIKNKPDIYYFIFDRYPSSKTLNEVYEYDNREFLNYLERKGFYIAEESKSNYHVTFQSIASSLNMNYINYLSEIEGASTRKGITYALHTSCESCEFLKSQGYEYIHFAYFFQPDKDIWKAGRDPENFFKNRLEDFSTLFYKTTFLYYITTTYISNLGENPLENVDEEERKQKYDRILFEFENLEKIPKIKKPTFVFTHMLIPHPPYVFDENGNYLSLEDSKKFHPQEKFNNQLTFLNKKIQNLVDKLISESEEPPIIIISSDEGPYPYRAVMLGDDEFNWSTPTIEELETKLQIINAFYLPNKDTSVLYPTISPVNIFRVVFNEYFYTELELLSDSHYVYKDKDNYYDFIDVTDKLNNQSLKYVDFEKEFNEKIEWEKIGIKDLDINKFEYITELLTIYYQRDDLQIAFPEVEDGELRYLFDWASDYASDVYPHLSKYDPIYDLIRTYNNSKNIKEMFPEAKNGIDLSGLYCWANSEVEKENNSFLTPHALFYREQCHT